MARSLTLFLFLLVTTAVIAVRDASAGLVPAVPVGKRYIVGGAEGWRVPPPENKDMYIKWADSIQFFVEDSIEFMYKNDTVGKVTKYAYYHCNWTALASTTPPNKVASSLFLLDTPGFVYFASTDTKHCKKGQRLMLNVKARETAPSPAPSADAPTHHVAGPPLSAQGPAAPGDALMVDSASALALSSAPALALGVSVTVLAFMGLIRA
uniref:Uncharacterized protein n=1 Tax=Avena sativa TaxID=4498 RepID=A0ACD6A9D3_AVESA